MKKKSELIEDFCEMGDRVALYLLDGTYYEGYILDIEEDYFSFGLGGPMAPDEPIQIKYDDLDFGKTGIFDPDA
ncbi:MAG: hypothetical protein OEZ39_19900 [Gammaproteobacteria bacterium]|nr:hypothetical protein [Gammaproteobacteria bacterium]MDH5654132.1 hypothetical protein [Gammaproteobacteria bacterium]